MSRAKRKRINAMRRKQCRRWRLLRTSVCTNDWAGSPLAVMVPPGEDMAHPTPEGYREYVASFEVRGGPSISITYANGVEIVSYYDEPLHVVRR